jgi:hypothetical protein
MLRVASHRVVNRHQLAMGKDLESPTIPERKCFFPHSYGLFCWVGTMHVWWCVLEVSVLRADKCFHLVERFIVQFVEFGFDPSQYKPFICFTARTEEFFLRGVFDWDRLDIVGVEYVEDNNICVAPI